MICGGRSGRFEIDPWGNCYHGDHVRGVATCHQCDRKCHPAITGSAGTTLKDGRTVCGSCLATAVKSARVAGQRMHRVAAQLRQSGIRVNLAAVSVSLVDQSALTQSDSTLGLTRSQWTLSRGRRRFDSARIKVLSHLAAPLFDSVIAHELMHVWFAQHISHPVDRCTEEGVCQLASDIVLAAEPSDDLAVYLREKLMADDDPIYGDCFKKASAIAAKRGISALLTQLR